jgi:hypothetical protein
MKVTLSNNKVRVNGKEVGYYTQMLNGNWIAVFDYNGLGYTRQATKLSYLRDILKIVINEQITN